MLAYMNDIQKWNSKNYVKSVAVFHADVSKISLFIVITTNEWSIYLKLIEKKWSS